MSEKGIENIPKSNSFFAPTFVSHHIVPDVNFNGHCLINDISIPNKVKYIYISYILNQWARDLNTNFTLGNCLLDQYPDKYVYTGYAIWFNLRSEFSLPDGCVGKNAITFGADMSSSVHIDNKRNDILILVKNQQKN